MQVVVVFFFNIRQLFIIFILVKFPLLTDFICVFYFNKATTNTTVKCQKYLALKIDILLVRKMSVRVD